MADARDIWGPMMAQWGLDTQEIKDLLNRSVTEGGGWSNERLQQELFGSGTFKQAFPEYQAAIAAGNPMDPGEILDYRTQVKSVMFNAGMPAGFYDQNQDFADLISKRLSPVELEGRVQQGFSRVNNAPQEVKDALDRKSVV